MADVAIRGPDCDEEGERGRRGRRGRRGPDGPTGPTGPSGTGNPQAFRYTVTGLEPDLSDFMITLPAARATDVYRVVGTLSGVTVIVAFDLPDLVAGDRTTTQFRFVTSAPMTAGDQIDFIVMDPT